MDHYLEQQMDKEDRHDAMMEQEVRQLRIREAARRWQALQTKQADLHQELSLAHEASLREKQTLRTLMRWKVNIVISNDCPKEVMDYHTAKAYIGTRLKDAGQQWEENPSLYMIQFVNLGSYAGQPVLAYMRAVDEDVEHASLERKR